ncbi:hypothetical protein [Actinosynnema sp. NPDC020468]|uniref:hypothetical protein n=1 Tax=Actinosynnema sp. NPDC020468 TaxID=3154488 RepID=UPI0033E30516
MAVAPRTNKPMPGVSAEYVAPPPEGPRIGIALSGGGIRSAAFNLGAMQALQENGLMDNAEYLAAVSGGNYVASALAISAARVDPEFANGKPPWGSGSPEERYLRQHTDYLAPGWVGKLWMLASVVYGFLVNYVPFVLTAVIVGRLAGWGLWSVGVPLSDLRLNGLRPPHSVLVAVLVGAVAAAVLAALLLVLYRRWFKNDDPGDYGGSAAEKVASRLLVSAGVLLVAMALPPLARAYGAGSTWVLAAVFHEDPALFHTTWGRLVMAFLWLLVSLVLAGVALVLSNRFRARRAMLVLSSLAGAGLLLVPLLSALEHSARTGLHSWSDAIGVTAFALVLLGMAVFVHNRRYSMHLFYRERLNSAFALHRTRDEQGRVVAQPIDFRERLYFTDLKPLTRMPKLVVCCAVNLTTDDVPVGRFAESFTFEQDRSGGPLFDYDDTFRMEQRDGLAGTQLTLPSLMAVSGAALSPLMGRYTYPPLRFLMALTNVRLGVWIKNPLHQAWRAPVEPTTGWSRAWRAVKRGWLEPGAWYVLREALGAAKSTHRYIYLTDGGHWENLGLVELLRRRCTHILCFDASSDTTGGGLDIGRAIALARSELNVDITLNPRPVLPNEDGMSEEMTVEGTMRYPNPGAQEGKLVYAKAVLTPTATWDLHAFKARDSRFPNHSTGRQMFTDEQFEAYRTLGHEAGNQACTRLNLAPRQWKRP